MAQQPSEADDIDAAYIADLTRLERIYSRQDPATHRLIVRTYIRAHYQPQDDRRDRETDEEFSSRQQEDIHNLDSALALLDVYSEHDELGRIQEECESGDDPGDDEDGACGEDIRSGLRSGREV